MTQRASLMTIAEAARSLHNAVTPSALHSARRNGQLWAKKIGKCYFTTEAAIMEFLECPDTASPPGSTSAAMSNSGSFETEAPKNGRALALASAERLKKLSRNTSRADNRQPAPVHHIHQK